MAGAIALIIAMVLFVPLLIGGLGMIAVLLGWSFTEDARARYAGSELTTLEHPEPEPDAS
jgi:hypothetical protein